MKEWQKMKLSDLSKNKDAIVSGPFGSNLKVSDYKESGIPILRLQNVGKGYFVNKDIKYISEKKAQELKYHSFKAGDLVLAKLGIPVGKTCIVPERFPNGIIVADVVRIRPDKNVVDYKFLEYFLNTDDAVDQLTGNITGATRPRVNLSDVRDIELHIPLLPEQKRIVAILDETFAAIDKAKANVEKNLKNAKELFESYLQDVFTNPSEDWEEKKLKDIGETQTGTTPKTSEKNNYGSFIPFIKPATIDIDGNGAIYYDDEGLSEKGLKAGRVMKKGTVLMVCIGASIGKVGYTERDISCNQQINAFTVKKGFNSKYFYYALRTKEFFDKVLLNSAQATLPIINKSKWENLTVRFPVNLDQQKVIAAKLDELSVEAKKLEYIYQQKLIALDELKKSTLQKAFSGELDYV
jgi:type I restriction enzyme S subunit